MRTQTADTADYVVIGAGSAGCVVAGELAAAGASVIVVEAGGTDRRLDVALPLGMASAYRRANWLYPCARDPSKNGSTDTQAAGRIVGGSGSINAMIYVRGRREDFERWTESGCDGWSYDDVLPHFRALENWVGGADAYRGSGGPITVSWCGHRHEIDAAFIDATTGAGFPLNNDYNGSAQLGVSWSQVNQRHGWRSSSAHGYLRRNPPHLRPQVRTDFTAARITFDGERAIGVAGRDGTRIRAREELILSAGTMGSPALLMRSGVGPSGSVVDLGGVGENFQDHLVVPDAWGSRVPTLNTLGPVGAARAVGDFVRSGTGALTAVPFEAQLFTPDLQIAVTPMTYRINKTTGRTTLDRIDGFTVFTVVLHPTCRGRVRLVGDGPQVEFARLAHPEDMRALSQGCMLARDLVRAPAMRAVATEPRNPALPDGDVLRAMEASIAHAVGTCRMGTDELAVVDPQLRVHGTRNLRVVDASVIPFLPSGNPNATTMMVAHRAAELIRR